MPRKGRITELLVAQLQEHLSISDITVQSPEEFYESGIKIGEVDVSIRGKFGSTEIAIGIECRDRPSSGPQGVDWLREIFGKQDDLGFHKMIAVSTTGFAGPAIKFARKKHIDTLIISNPKEISSTPFFESIDIKISNALVNIDGVVNIDFDESPNDLKPFTLKESRPFVDKSGNKLSMDDILNHEVVKQLPSNPIESKFLLDLKNKYSYIFNGKPQKAKKFLIPISIVKESMQTALVINICHDNDGNVIGNTGICSCKLNDVEGYIMASIIEVGGQRQLRIRTFDKGLNPYQYKGEITLLH